MAPIRDERELYFEHTLDIAWIIALWHWIHGGDPMQDSEAARTTELMARALVGNMARGRTERGDAVKKLAELGFKVVLKSEDKDGKEVELKSAAEFQTAQPARVPGGPVAIWPCVLKAGFKGCWNPFFEPRKIPPK
jgi:hypothetical protein